MSATNYTRDELGKFKRKELRDIATAHGLKGFWKMNHAKLVEFLLKTVAKPDQKQSSLVETTQPLQRPNIRRMGPLKPKKPGKRKQHQMVSSAQQEQQESDVPAKKHGRLECVQNRHVAEEVRNTMTDWQAKIMWAKKCPTGLPDKMNMTESDCRDIIIAIKTSGFQSLKEAKSEVLSWKEDYAKKLLELLRRAYDTKDYRYIAFGTVELELDGTGDIVEEPAACFDYSGRIVLEYENLSHDDIQIVGEQQADGFFYTIDGSEDKEFFFSFWTNDETYDDFLSQITISDPPSNRAELAQKFRSDLDNLEKYSPSSVAIPEPPIFHEHVPLFMKMDPALEAWIHDDKCIELRGPEKPLRDCLQDSRNKAYELCRDLLDKLKVSSLFLVNDAVEGTTTGVCVRQENEKHAKNIYECAELYKLYNIPSDEGPMCCFVIGHDHKLRFLPNEHFNNAVLDNIVDKHGYKVIAEALQEHQHNKADAKAKVLSLLTSLVS